MINVNTGELTVNCFPRNLGPKFTRGDLSLLPVKIVSVVVNEPYHSYSLGKQMIGSEAFSIIVYFYGQVLESIQIAKIADEFSQSWDDWSREKEMKRKEVHDQWLQLQKGQSANVYEWGEVSSVYDAKSGSSGIHIIYSWKGLPWPSCKACCYVPR